MNSRNLKAYLSSTDQVIFGEVVNTTLVEIVFLNPVRVIIEKDDTTGKQHMALRYLFPRELLADPDQERIVKFDRNYLVGEIDTKQFNEAIIQQYIRINTPIKNLKELK